MGKYTKGECLLNLIRKNPLLLVDKEDKEEYGVLTAHIQAQGYVVVRVKGKLELLHRLVMGSPDSFVDHKNGCRLDCRKSNLRLATATQNTQNSSLYSNNTSGYKGVHLFKNKYWAASIVYLKKKIHIGYFDSPEKAAEAYNKKALELFKEFAKLNEIKQAGD